jgi:hypothetical protein
VNYFSLSIVRQSLAAANDACVDRARAWLARLDLNGKPECSMLQLDPYAGQNYRELARNGDCGLSLLVV